MLLEICISVLIVNCDLDLIPFIRIFFHLEASGGDRSDGSVFVAPCPWTVWLKPLSASWLCAKQFYLRNNHFGFAVVFLADVEHCYLNLLLFLHWNLSAGAPLDVN